MSESASPHVRTTTSLSGNWLMKQGLFLLVLLVFGVWGLADALYFYPRRGLEDASYKLRNYLTAASEAGKLVPSEIAIADPQAAYADLAPRMEQLAKAATGPGNEAKNAKIELERARWLEALSRTWRLTTEPQIVVSPGQLPKDFVDAATRTVRYDPVRGIGLVVSQPGSEPLEVPPQRLLGELVQKWNTRDQVKPLSGYDMPLQWVFVTVGFVGGGALLFTMLRASAKKYRWDPATQTLTLPGGKSFTPADVKEFDKRRWHKFFVTIHLKDGTSHTLDLLRYVPLEEWVLTMERTAFPETAVAPVPTSEPEAVAAGNSDTATPNNG